MLAAVVSLDTVLHRLQDAGDARKPQRICSPDYYGHVCRSPQHEKFRAG